VPGCTDTVTPRTIVTISQGDFALTRHVRGGTFSHI